MTGNVIISPITKGGAIPTEYSQENAAVSAYIEQKVANERDSKSIKYSDAVLQINFVQTLLGIGSFTTSNTGVLSISTGAQASSGLTFLTKSNADQPIGRGVLLRIPIQFVNAGVAGNIRSIGLHDDTDGFMLRLNGTALEFVTTKGGVDTIIDSSNWDIPVIPDTNIHLWEIQTKSAALGDYDIYLDKIKVHSIRILGTASTESSDKDDLPFRIENNNSTNAADINFNIHPTLLIEEGKSATIITDGEKDITINAGGRMNVQSSFVYLMSSEFDLPLNEVNLWNVTTDGAASFAQPINTYTLELKNTTAAADNILIKSQLLNLKAGAGEFSTFEVGLKFGTNNPANHIKEWGYKDNADLNGVFYRLEGGVFKFVVLKGGIESVTTISQAKPNSDFHNFRIEHLGAGKIIGSIINEGEIIDFSPAAISQVGASEKQPFLRAYNTGVPASTPDDLEAHWIRLLDNSGNALVIQGRDDNGVFRPVAVNAASRLLVSQEPSVPAPGESAISDTQFDSVATVDDNFVTIPTGKIVTIDRFSAGAESGNGGSKVELFEAPNGDATGLIFISVLFIDASSDQNDLAYKTTAGDGTRAILLRRERFGGGSVEIFGSWIGTHLT